MHEAGTPFMPIFQMSALRHSKADSLSRITQVVGVELGLKLRQSGSILIPPLLWLIQGIAMFGQ